MFFSALFGTKNVILDKNSCGFPHSHKFPYHGSLACSVIIETILSLDACVYSLFPLVAQSHLILPKPRSFADCDVLLATFEADL